MEFSNRHSCQEAGLSSDQETVPLAIVMIAFNEEHHMEGVLRNVTSWAREIFLVDSYSTDRTVEIALRHGVKVVQRRFRGFGDQWNFALRSLPISTPWIMKLDPDERLTGTLKNSIEQAIEDGNAEGFTVQARLWFMSHPLPVTIRTTRIWKAGTCRFSDVSVNEHAIVDGRILDLEGDLEHHDSKDLHHWIAKQNRYTSLEARARYRKEGFAAEPRFTGNALERRMWFKKVFFGIPCRYLLLFFLNLARVRVWKTGRIGVAWARARVWVMRTVEDKWREMEQVGMETQLPARAEGPPHPGAQQADERGEPHVNEESE